MHMFMQGHKVAIKDHPVPPVGDNDILIKTVSVAQNPTDWKRMCIDSYSGSKTIDHPYLHAGWLADVDDNGKPGTVLGVDFSGTVVKAGKAVASPKVGEHVAGFVHGACFEDEGAFAEYIKTPADLVWVVPKGTLSHDEASTLGCACVLFRRVPRVFAERWALGIVS